MAALKGDKTLAELAEVRPPCQSDYAMEEPVAPGRHGRVSDACRATQTGRTQRQDMQRPRSGSSRWKMIFGRRARSHRRCGESEMIDRDHELPISAKPKLVNISRSCHRPAPGRTSLPKPVSDDDTAVMRRIDELHLNFPFARRPDVARHASAGGHRDQAQKHVNTLMRRWASPRSTASATPVRRIPSTGSIRTC